MLGKILIAVAVVFAFLVCGGIYLAHWAHQELTRDAQVDKEKLQPRVIKGGEQFEKHDFYAGADVGEISEILAGWPADREGAALTIVGNRGALFLDANQRPVKEIRFSRTIFCPVEVSKIDSSGDYGYLTRDESWSSPVILFDRDGKERWSYSGGLLKGVDDSVSLGAEETTKSGVVVGFNGGGGLVLLDRQGKPIWQKPESNVWHVETLDTNEDGHKEILHSNAQGQLLVGNTNGDIIGRYLPGAYVSNFSITRWEDDPQPTHILVPIKEGRDGGRPQLLVLDAGGKTVAELDAPLGDLMHGVTGVSVHFGRNAEYYAALMNKGHSRSIVLLYDKQRQIAYQEVLGESCFGITALPGRSGERLLIGCSGRVVEYTRVAHSDER
ncbi:MAG TPA: hypothetical protein VE778_02625 [Candidatus Bathyarchaeia archaeon]|jgi:hypothetical protein|nr:hypothetical protein [Candidatus Bathyarchaeia archaeon]